MKRWIAAFLVCVMAFSFTACGKGDKESDNDGVKYVYDDAGRLIKEEIYGTGLYYDENHVVQTKNGILMEIEYRYNEKGQMAEKLWRDLLQLSPVTQREEYAYYDQGQAREVKIYDTNNEHFCTTVYAYYESGAIMSKESTYKMKSTSSYPGPDGETVAVYSTSDYYYEPVRRTTNQGSFTLYQEEAPEKELILVNLVEYHENGLEKAVTRSYADTVIRTEYPNNENYQDTIVAWDDQNLKDTAKKLYYLPMGDGTYSTMGYAGVKEYEYDSEGNLKGCAVYDENGGCVAETYYSNGTVRIRRELRLPEYGLNYYYPTKIEEFYESGAKKSLKVVDLDSNTSTYTEWDEAGNVIATEEPKN